MTALKEDLPGLLKKLNEIGIALSAEKDHNRLLEFIIMQGCEFTRADGGTLYSRSEDDRLKFEILISHSLDMHMGGSSGESVPFAPLPLHDAQGEPNNHMVAACAALSGKTINIPDAYSDQSFDFSGTREFDQQTGYRSQSFLTVPMVNHENEIIGVLQLINAQDLETGSVRPFTALDQQLVESLASQAAVSISNRNLIEAQKNLFDSFIQLIASAIDEKSPYTAGHCRRVPVLTDMLADAACHTQVGPLAAFSMTEEEKYELSVAAWLHDCGKITTPEYVVDKSTKLETIFDRVEMVDTRFEVLQRDAEIEALRRRLREYAPEVAARALTEDPAYQQAVKALEDDRAFIHRVNIGGEFLSEEDCERIHEVASHHWCCQGEVIRHFLNDDEVRNLLIGRGTLTDAERLIINNHVAVTIKMLESLPYPKHLRRVPEYAGGHHERIDGTGYPQHLTREQMSIPARMMAIADIFEALTAKDRPYKPAMPLSQALNILGRMCVERHIDPDLFQVFIREQVYLEYAREYLAPAQIDAIAIDSIPGYTPVSP